MNKIGYFNKKVNNTERKFLKRDKIRVIYSKDKYIEGVIKDLGDDFIEIETTKIIKGGYNIPITEFNNYYILDYSIKDDSIILID